MIQAPRLAVVIPAYDEMPNLRKLVPAIHDALAGCSLEEASILVVLNSGATPSDFDELRALGCTPVPRSPSDSFGDAIRTGIRACPTDTDYVIFMDGDGSHDPASIPRLLAAAPEGDIVIASRYTKGGRTDNGFVLKAMSRSLNVAYGLVLGLKCHDVSTNFKLYRYEQIRDLTLTCRNFDVVEELLFRVRQQVGPDMRIIEIPDYFRERDEGVTKRQLGPFVASYLATLIKLRLRG